MFEECCEVSTDARGHVVDCTPRALDQIRKTVAERQ